MTGIRLYSRILVIQEYRAGFVKDRSTGLNNCIALGKWNMI